MVVVKRAIDRRMWWNVCESTYCPIAQLDLKIWRNQITSNRFRPPNTLCRVLRRALSDELVKQHIADLAIKQPGTGTSRAVADARRVGRGGIA